ncbi:MAG: C39 family peptidase [Thermodesulfovibrionales bacterium]
MGKRQWRHSGPETDRKPLWSIAFCLGVLVSILYSCSSVSVRLDSKPVIIDKVPFYPQEDYQCGPSSLAAVLNYHGVAVRPEDIARDIYSGSARGTLNIEMVFYSQKMGLNASQYSGGLDDLRENINSGHPLIVLVDYGFSLFQVNHFMVVIGYNDDGVIVNSGKEEKKFIPERDFMRAWERTKFWTLLIRQKTEIESQKSEK